MGNSRADGSFKEIMRRMALNIMASVPLLIGPAATQALAAQDAPHSQAGAGESAELVWKREFNAQAISAEEAAGLPERDLRARRAVDRLLFPRLMREDFDALTARIPLTANQREIADILFERYEREIDGATDAILTARPLVGGDRTALVNGLGEFDEKFAHVVESILILAYGENEIEEDEQARRPARLWIRRLVILPELQPFPGYTQWHVAGDDMDLAATFDTFLASLDAGDRERLGPEIQANREDYVEDIEMILDRLIEFHRLAILEEFEAAGDEQAKRRAWRRDRSRWVEQDAVIQRHHARMRQMLTAAERPDLVRSWTTMLLHDRFPTLYASAPSGSDLRAWFVANLPEYAQNESIVARIDLYDRALNDLRNEAWRVIRTARRTMHPTLDGREPQPADSDDKDGRRLEPIADAKPSMYGEILEQEHGVLRDALLTDLLEILGGDVNAETAAALRSLLMREQKAE